MRRPYPYPLTKEEAERMMAVLTRHGGSRTLRDLARRHRFWDPLHLEQMEAIGLIRIEKHQPRTGRPSFVAVVCSDAVNNYHAAKLPNRKNLPHGLSWREEDFLLHFMCKRGTSFFGEGKYAGSAAHTYRKVYGKHRRITDASARSAGARLLRQPWMRAALILYRRLMSHGGREGWPVDMRSEAQAWLYLLRRINWETPDWPATVAAILNTSPTFPAAYRRLKEAGLHPDG